MVSCVKIIIKVLSFHNIHFLYLILIDSIKTKYHAITSMVRSQFKLYFEKVDQKEFGFDIGPMHKIGYVQKIDDEKRNSKNDRSLFYQQRKFC